jgi:hypothetical protein
LIEKAFLEIEQETYWIKGVISMNWPAFLVVTGKPRKISKKTSC